MNNKQSDYGREKILRENAILDNMGKENNPKIAIYSNNTLEIHFCNKEVDETMFNIKEYAQDGQVVFLSHKLDAIKLSNKIISTEKQIAEFNDKDKTPLENFDMYMRLIAPYYQVIIEGIDYNYIKDHISEIFSKRFSRTYGDTKQKVYLGIVNVPLENREELKQHIYMIAYGVRVCFSISKKKKSLPVENLVMKE